MSQTSYRERRGAHRPPGLGPAGAIPWFVAAVAVLAIVAYASGWWGGGSSDDDGAAVTTASQGTTKATGKATGKTTGTATGKPSSSATSTPASPTTPASTVDPTQPVTVLNATKTSGLAAGAATKLRSAGWTIDSTGNYRGGLAATTVFYGKASLAATAQAIAADLGSGVAVQESADFGATKVTAVLAADYVS